MMSLGIKKELSKISIVTPSFNQAQFLEQTICSVLDQRYPNLEYIVIEGGTSGGSVTIIKKYAQRNDFLMEVMSVACSANVLCVPSEKFLPI